MKALIYQCFYFAVSAKNGIFGSLMLRSAHNSDKWRFNASLFCKALITSDNKFFNERKFFSSRNIFTPLRLWKYSKIELFTLLHWGGLGCNRTHGDSAEVFTLSENKNIGISIILFCLWFYFLKKQLPYAPFGSQLREITRLTNRWYKIIDTAYAYNSLLIYHAMKTGSIYRIQIYITMLKKQAYY